MYFLGDIKLQAALLLHQKIYVKIQPAVQTMRCNNVSYWCMLNPFLELLLEEDQKENLQMLLLENCSQLHLTKTKTNFFKNSFFPAAIVEWNKLDVDIPNSVYCKNTLIALSSSPLTYVFHYFAENVVTLQGTANFGLCDLRQNEQFSNGYVMGNIYSKYSQVLF